MKYARRPALGVVFGVLWYCGLLIPESTRAELTGANGRSPIRLLVLMLLTSVLLSLVRPFTSVPSKWATSIYGLLLPVFGASVYVLLVLATELSLTVESPTNLVGAFVGVIAMTAFGVPIMVGAVYIKAFYVIVPVGFAHAYVLCRFGSARGPDCPGRPPAFGQGSRS